MIRLAAGFALVAMSMIPLSALRTTTPQSSPKAVVDAFLRMAINGDLLTPDGWNEADLLFAHPNRMPHEKSLTVIGRDYSVREISVRGNHSEVFATYRALGEIDSSMRYTPPDAWPQKVVTRYDLILKSAEGAGDQSSHQVDAGQWRIETPQRTTLVGLEAALAHVTATRDKASDPVVKRNAAITLVQLKKFQQ